MNMAENKIMCNIKYYLGNLYLGCSYIPERSTPKDRRLAALKRGIMYYDGIIINGRDLRSFRIIGNKRHRIDFKSNTVKGMMERQALQNCKEINKQ